MTVVRDIFSRKQEWDSDKEESLNLIIEKDASHAFPPEIWRMFTAGLLEFTNKKILVPSSGDNFAVFAFSLLGAIVTSTDFTPEVLVNAENRANERAFANITFKNCDTMALTDLPDNEFDLVFTSNGVYNCLHDIEKAHSSIYRVLKPNGTYCFYENHPFYNKLSEEIDSAGRTYKGTGKLCFDAKNYRTFVEKDSVNNFYTIEDYINSLLKAGFRLMDYCDIRRPQNTIPFFARRGIRFISKEIMPIWLGISAKKPSK